MLEQRKGRRMLLGLVFFFALPIALVLALHLSGWRPSGASHGELLAPPQPLQLPALHDLAGRPFSSQQWRGKWILLYAAGNDGCSVSCQQQVYLLRQVHATLGKDIERTRRVLLLPQSAGQRGLSALRSHYPDLIVLLAEAPLQLAGQQSGVFLVDPLGNLILRYPSDYDPQGLRKDLQRLLKYSWVG